MTCRTTGLGVDFGGVGFSGGGVTTGFTTGGGMSGGGVQTATRIVRAGGSDGGVGRGTHSQPISPRNAVLSSADAAKDQNKRFDSEVVGMILVLKTLPTPPEFPPHRPVNPVPLPASTMFQTRTAWQETHLGTSNRKPSLRPLLGRWSA